MKAQLIVAHSDGTWTSEMVEVPAGVVPEKYYRGSVKWNSAVIKWATNNMKFEREDLEVAYIGMMNSDPDYSE